MTQLQVGESSRAFIYPSLVIVSVLGALLYANAFHKGARPNVTDHLGGEHYCVAEALAAGRGFSDPFGVPTGPTAWVRPSFLCACLSAESAGQTRCGCRRRRDAPKRYPNLFGTARAPSRFSAGQPVGFARIAFGLYAITVAYNSYY